MKNEENKKNGKLLLIILTVAGLVAGYCYYRFIGCASGTCAIASNVFLSTGFGGVIGYLIGATFTPAPEVEEGSPRRGGG